jgi:phenylpyruvate tautomerase PptA (4-oxalocrotonate tautomerase family)
VPVVRIDITGPKPAEYKRALLAAARRAITEGLSAPDERVTVRIVEVPSEDCDLPACRTPRFTLVDVLMYEGRSEEAKAATAAELRGLLEADPGIEGSEVSIAFHDMSPTDLDVLPGEASA